MKALTRSGGTVETRLALQAAAEFIDDFWHGVCFVHLGAVAGCERVAAGPP
jgi:predicted ATPase